jgi:hypothetical protein
MDAFPDYLKFILFGILAAVISAQFKFSAKGNAVAVAGLILSVCLLGYGVYLFTKEPMPCDGMETLDNASMEEMECVAKYLGRPVIDK